MIRVILPVFSVLLGFSLAAVSQEPRPPAPADDLPAEFRILGGIGFDRDTRWTLIGTNQLAARDEALHAGLNVVKEVWHCSLAKGRHALKLIFTRPLRSGNHVFHIYVKADGDPGTGRKANPPIGGVDYMYTLVDGTPGTERDAWACWGSDGASREKPHLTVRRGDTLYLSVDMSAQQQDGGSVFEFMTTSYVREQTDQGWRSLATSNFGFVKAVGDPEPDTPVNAEGGSPVINPDLALINGTVPGWQAFTSRQPFEATFGTDDEQALTIGPLYSPEGLGQTLSLSPGHYLLRARARTSVFQIHLVADRKRIPVSVGDELRWVELPFCVPRSDDGSRRDVLIGFRYLARPATGNASRLPAKLTVKKVELVRLGNTVISEKWIENAPVDPLHRLRLLRDEPSWDRSGKVVFTDSLVGTELWLMTQAGQVDHSYVGHPDFSRDGKYLHYGVRRPPRGLLRTDGSARYCDDRWSELVWLFPWMERRLPGGADPADWVVLSHTAAGVDLQNVVTKETHRIDLPGRSGWSLVHYPGMASYGGRGPRIPGITHETLVWLSDDRKMLALSTVAGGNFRAFPVKSISNQPAGDTLTPSMSSVGGKSGDNWRDAVDRQGRRYFCFELNRDHLPNHPENPYQVWVLCVTDGDDRGPLRVLSHPEGPVAEYVTSQTGMTMQPSAKWWDFAAGYPWSGDNAILRLEDETLVHMSSLGMHSSFLGGETASVNDPVTGDARFVATFPMFDRITWPHEFLRDVDFAVTTSHCEPTSPVAMFDLRHATLWTLAFSNFHDYSKRYKTRWDKTAYHKPMFRPAPTFSPDFTKVSFFSAMLTGDSPDRKWGDLYVAVARYPEPPVNLRLQGRTLSWEMPPHHTEIAGFRLYRSAESGCNYERVGDTLLSGTTCELPPGSKGFYVLTSVEYSGLEGRVFSDEVRVATEGPFRHFYQAEAGEVAAPMVPFFEPGAAAGAYAVAITDPELLYKARLVAGLTGIVKVRTAIPKTGPVRILARVRGMSTIERSSYTRGWPAGEDVAAGTFAVSVNGRSVGEIAVRGPHWKWTALGAGAVALSAGAAELTLTTSDAGIAVDSIVLTDAPGFVPQGRGQAPAELAAVPSGLRTGTFGPADAEKLTVKTARVKLVWEPVTAPQGVSHYNVYRADVPSFPAEPEYLLGSPAGTVFYDCGLAKDRKLYYRVCAVDAWGNRSPPSAALAVSAPGASGIDRRGLEVTPLDPRDGKAGAP